MRHPQEPLFHKNATQPGAGGLEFFSREVGTFSGGVGASILKLLFLLAAIFLVKGGEVRKSWLYFHFTGSDNRSSTGGIV